MEFYRWKRWEEWASSSSFNKRRCDLISEGKQFSYYECSHYSEHKRVGRPRKEDVKKASCPAGLSVTVTKDDVTVIYHKTHMEPDSDFTSWASNNHKSEDPGETLKVGFSRKMLKKVFADLPRVETEFMDFLNSQFKDNKLKHFADGPFSKNSEDKALVPLTVTCISNSISNQSNYPIAGKSSENSEQNNSAKDTVIETKKNMQQNVMSSGETDTCCNQSMFSGEEINDTSTVASEEFNMFDSDILCDEEVDMCYNNILFSKGPDMLHDSNALPSEDADGCSSKNIFSSEETCNRSLLPFEMRAMHTALPEETNIGCNKNEPYKELDVCDNNRTSPSEECNNRSTSPSEEMDICDDNYIFLPEEVDVCFSNIMISKGTDMSHGSNILPSNMTDVCNKKITYGEMDMFHNQNTMPSENMGICHNKNIAVSTVTVSKHDKTMIPPKEDMQYNNKNTLLSEDTNGCCSKDMSPAKKVLIHPSTNRGLSEEQYNKNILPFNKLDIGNTGCTSSVGMMKNLPVDYSDYVTRVKDKATKIIESITSVSEISIEALRGIIANLDSALSIIKIDSVLNIVKNDSTDKMSEKDILEKSFKNKVENDTEISTDNTLLEETMSKESIGTSCIAADELETSNNNVLSQENRSKKSFDHQGNSCNEILTRLGPKTEIE